jgi:hypothetical protein
MRLALAVHGGERRAPHLGAAAQELAGLCRLVSCARRPHGANVRQLDGHLRPRVRAVLEALDRRLAIARVVCSTSPSPTVSRRVRRPLGRVGWAIHRACMSWRATSSSRRRAAAAMAASTAALRSNGSGVGAGSAPAAAVPAAVAAVSRSQMNSAKRDVGMPSIEECCAPTTPSSDCWPHKRRRRDMSPYLAKHAGLPVGEYDQLDGLVEEAVAAVAVPERAARLPDRRRSSAHVPMSVGAIHGTQPPAIVVVGMWVVEGHTSVRVPGVVSSRQTVRIELSSSSKCLRLLGLRDSRPASACTEKQRSEGQ